MSADETGKNSQTGKLTSNEVSLPENAADSPALSTGASSPEGSVIEVAINGLSDAQQTVARRMALRVTLLRTGGDKDLMNSEVARESLANAEKYIKSLDIREASQSDLVSGIPMTTQVRDTGQVTHIAVITVDDEAVDLLVTQVEHETDQARKEEGEVTSAPAGLSTLVWLLVRDGGREVIVTERTAESIVARAREIAGSNGHILKFPVVGSKELTAETLSAGNQDAIVAASRRYRSAAVLIGVLDRVDRVSWSGKWRHLDNEGAREQPLSAHSLDELLKLGLDWYTGLSSDNAPSAAAANPSGDRKGFVWVNTTDTGKAYRRLMSMFQRMASDTQFFPEELTSGGILFSVSPASAIGDIRNGAESLSWLESLGVTDPSLSSSGAPEGVDAYFRYVP